MQPTPATERWSINMPAVIGVVVVFLVGVVVWVVISSNSDDDTSGGGTTTPAASTDGSALPATTAPVTPPPTLSPTPLPSTVPPTTGSPTTVAPTTAPVTTVPVTTAPDAPDGAVPGDLAIPGRPMQQPPCDDGYITVLASAIGAQATAPGVGAVLEQYPGSNYLRTDQTCPSLTPDVDGAPIYVVYFGPYIVASDACTARADGPDDAYARQLSDELGPDHTVLCP